MKKDMEGNARSLAEVLSRYLREEFEENHERFIGGR
jgi:hypothetical protein